MTNDDEVLPLTRTDPTPERLWVQLPREGRLHTSVATTVDDPLCREIPTRTEIHVLQPRYDNVPREVIPIRDALGGIEESQVIGGVVGEGERRSVVSVFEDDTYTVGSVGEDGEDAFLEVRKSRRSGGLAAIEDEHRTSLFVMLSVEPVPLVEGPVQVRMILG